MPEKFLSHKVKKKETVFGITQKHNITETQLYEYNPLLKKVGLGSVMEEVSLAREETQLNLYLKITLNYLKN